MLLFTQHQRQRLLANGQNRGDHVPLVKFFSPVGAATWLLSELDLHFEARFPLTVYVDAARLVGRITEDEARLEAAALAQRDNAL